jgi:WD40 repeat protein
VVIAGSRYNIVDPKGRWRFDIDTSTLQGRAVDIATSTVVYNPPPERFSQAVASPDGRHLALVNPVDKVRILDTATWKEVTTISRETVNGPPLRGLDRYLVGDIAYSASGSRLAITYLNDRMTVFSARDYSMLYETTRTIGVGPSVAFSPDGSQIVTGGNDDRAIIWNADTGVPIHSMRGNNRPIMRSIFNGDGTRLVTLARDRTVRLWDTVKGRELMTVMQTPDGILPAGGAFTRDDKALVILLSNGQIEMFDSMPWEEAAYPEAANAQMTLARRIELHNRRQLLGDHVTVEDLLHVPTLPTIDYSSATLNAGAGR